MKIFRSKYCLLPGSSYEEALRHARREYHSIQKRTPRRQPYVRSKYFTKDKIFLSSFWDHLNQKTRPDKLRRVRLYACAIDAIRNAGGSVVMQDPHNQDVALHRFVAITKEGVRFAVQIKENKKTGRKDFMSVFPANATNKKGLPRGSSMTTGPEVLT